jgi:hypothetical protein
MLHYFSSLNYTYLWPLCASIYKGFHIFHIWGCLRTECWGEYLDQRGMEWREGRENCITRSFIICTLRQV